MNWIKRLRKKFPVQEVPAKKADARVAIAQDVLELLRIGGIEAKPGWYVTAPAKGVQYPEGVGDTFEGTALALRQPRSPVRCGVCAIGAATMAAVGLYDECEALEEDWISYNTESSDDTTMRDVLARWFTRQQLDLIECAFECENNFYSGGSAEEARENAVNFGHRYDDAEDRLRAIMENIVRNKGRFVV